MKPWSISYTGHGKKTTEEQIRNCITSDIICFPYSFWHNLAAVVSPCVLWCAPFGVLTLFALTYQKIF